MRTRRWWAVGSLVLAVLAVGIDTTILSLALPDLATGLHASTAQLQWFITAYTLVFAAAMIPGGMLGDRFGRKKMLIAALTVFGLGSLAAAYAPSPGAFIAARAVLGLGGAVILPMVLGTVSVLFGESERRKAIAIVMAATMLAFPVGPLLGGWLLGHFWWGSVFLINVPAVALGLVAVVAWLPESRSDRPRRLDPAGVLTSSAGLALLTYGVIQAGQDGWGDTAAVAPLAAGLLTLAAFVAWERRAYEPMVDLVLFRSAGFTWGTLLSTMVNFAMFGVLFAVPQYFQAILHVDAMGSGVRLLPLIGGMLAGVLVADRLATVSGANVAAGLGFAVLAAGMFAGSTTSVSDGYGPAALWSALCGVGLGFAMPAAADAALGTLPKDTGGVGSAVYQAVRMVGGTFGTAILGAVLGSGYRAGLPADAPHAVRESVFAGERAGSAAFRAEVSAAFVHGLDLLLAVCGGLAALGALLALVLLPRRRAVPIRQAAPEGTESEHESAV